METIVPVLSTIPLSLEQQAEELRKRTGEEAPPESIASALSWVIKRGTRGKVANGGQRFVAKSNN